MYFDGDSYSLSSAPVFSFFRLEDGPQVSPSASLFEDAEPVGQPMFVDPSDQTRAAKAGVIVKTYHQYHQCHWLFCFGLPVVFGWVMTRLLPGERVELKF